MQFNEALFALTASFLKIRLIFNQPYMRFYIVVINQYPVLSCKQLSIIDVG